MAITINIKLAEVYSNLCQQCKEVLLRAASANGAEEAVRESLRAQFEGKDGDKP